MPFRQITESCFADQIGEGGLGAAAYARALAATTPAIERLRKQQADGSLPLLGLPARRDDIAAFAPVAEDYRSRFQDVVVLGTGGSSLGGQTLYRLVDRGFGPPLGIPRLHFMDNVDPDTMGALAKAIDPGMTGVLAISKSGGTAETLAQLLVLLPAFEQAVGRARLGQHITVVTEPKASALGRIAERYGLPTLEHDPGVGGRFSVLSVTGLLPALIAGLDVEALRAGAAQVLQSTLAAGAPQEAPPAVGAAIAGGLLAERGVSQSVIMPYVDRLASFGLWYCQLWAESLGKDGTGTTPIRAVGAVDQHSQLQLYLAGPRDKLFTLLLLEVAGQGGRVERALADDEALAYLRGRSLGDLLDAMGRATAETLARNGRPLRLIRLPRLDEEVVGGLLMHFMLETILAAEILGVDPFDQPAVEEGKVLARKYLSALNASAAD
ncbi:MAG: glucose-6-phosphate isomerase [Kiloniellales bacterium]